VLAGIDYNDENKLGDAKQRDTVLHRLVQHFAKLDLRNARTSPSPTCWAAPTST
jgi:type I restriction enzyme M protein